MLEVTGLLCPRRDKTGQDFRGGSPFVVESDAFGFSCVLHLVGSTSGELERHC